MIRMQIRLTLEQARALKQLAAKEGKPVAELIRKGVDAMLRSDRAWDQETLRRKAIAASGRLSGEGDLSGRHDDYLADVLELEARRR